MKPRCPRSSSLCLPAIFLLTIMTVLPGAVLGAVSVDSVWSDVAEESITDGGARWIVPDRYRTVSLDPVALDSILKSAPMERSAAAEVADVALFLPLPDGSFGRFLIEESPVLHPELAARFPEIRTFRGAGLDDPTATARFDLTPAGFHAVILSSAGSVYIDPFGRGTTTEYVSYFTRDYRNPRDEGPECGFHRANPDASRHSFLPAGLIPEGGTTSGTELRTYRVAVAATGEYTAFHGGTVPDAMAAIVTAMNRVNGIYEREMAIFMQLIANNDSIVYTNGGTDPYTNNNGVTMLGQNQGNLDAVIGDANYDIGHVFSTGGGGVASLGVPCRSGSKARGVTGLTSPTGDVFYVDFVAHEMGHQWGGNHSFNGTAGSCAGGNRNGPTAYEPGSGSTIMAYAGICGSQNIQPNSDDYFHTVSFDEIIVYSTLSFGNGCPVTTATGNSPPVPDAGLSFTIPVGTPFILCGSATDPEGHSLTFGWEQFDLGPAGAPASPSGNAPIFRTFDPVPDPCRTFPQQSDLLNNVQTLGEILPATTRTLNFRMTARDNQAGGGGVAYDSVAIPVTAAAGPFLVTAPNTAVTWAGLSSQTVSWNVAGTDAAPVSCANVDILFSADGGLSFPTVVETGTANDGSQSIQVPNEETTQARIMVRCSDNIFFDLSNQNFTVKAVTAEIFSDGFEAGNTGMWSLVVP